MSRRFAFLPAPGLLALAVVLAAGAASPARAADRERHAPATYHFGTHPARTNVTFTSEAELETIHGVAHAMAGSVTWDADRRTATGRLAIPVRAMHTGIELRDAHMRGDQGGVWLEAAKYPDVVLTLTRAIPVEGQKHTFDVHGTLTLHGVSKPWNSRAQVRFVPAAVAGPARLGPGDWVRVKTGFDVAIEEFGVQVPEMVGAKVSKVWKVGVDIYGTTARPERKGS